MVGKGIKAFESVREDDFVKVMEIFDLESTPLIAGERGEGKRTDYD